MFDTKAFEEIGNRIGALIAASPARDVEKNVRALMSDLFTRMDLVTREEFDIQARLLAAARERLAALETRVAELEKAATP
ncbi:MAG: accessory factor UbiK family protein [Zoogloeaceae bacterium]|jgi:BMFP domain-containing protein YqiC|nr:accessory factor UbiK family protein [Zoogloeaceae bacterium]